VIACEYILTLRWPIVSAPIVLEQYRSEEMLFVTYWVERERIRAEIRWREPAFTNTPLPFYAPGTIIAADSDHFALSNAYRPKRTQFRSPYGPRPVLGSSGEAPYAVTDLRFAWRDAVAARIPSLGGAERFVLSGAEEAGNRVAQWITPGVVLQVNSFASPQKPERRIAYTYESNGEGGVALSGERVTLFEQRIPVDVSETGHSNVGDPTKKSRRIFIRRRIEGRECDVAWKRSRLEQGEALLPASIVVRAGASQGRLLAHQRTVVEETFDANGKPLAKRQLKTNVAESRYLDLPGRVLRSARLQQIRKADLRKGDLTDVDSAYAATWTPGERQWYRSVPSPYWGGAKQPDDSERSEIRRVTSTCLDELAAVGDSVSRLRGCYVSIVTSLILDDHEEFRKHIVAYRRELAECGVPSILAVCGDSLVTLCTRWGRTECLAIVHEVFLDDGRAHNAK
jgi:hypothetical protein